MSDLVFRGHPGLMGLTLLTLQTKEFSFNIYSIMQCCSLEVNFFTLSHPKVGKAASRGQPKDSLLIHRPIWVLNLKVSPVLATAESFGRRSNVKKEMNCVRSASILMNQTDRLEQYFVKCGPQTIAISII